jgi:ectoine hydroxylase-related dioxygenase (phytanoyl-CoA dioxygenase family)
MAAQVENFFAEPGDVPIWHAQLLHGGRPINDPRQTRLSLVTHYWTTHDYPREENRIDLGDGRLLCASPCQCCRR